jgi:hypothetical protein
VRRRLKHWAGLSWLMLGAAFAGCADGGDDLPRQAVSGSITLDGQPLADGRIQFEPASPEAKVVAGGAITDGQFSIPRIEGPTPGDYKVMITSGARKPTVEGLPGTEPPVVKSRKGAPKISPPAIELVSKEYNSNTKLTAKVEVGKPNTFEFVLTK